MKNRYPTLTPDQLYALENKARALRAKEIARLLKAAGNAVRQLLARIVAVRSAKGLRHA